MSSFLSDVKPFHILSTIGLVWHDCMIYYFFLSTTFFALFHCISLIYVLRGEKVGMDLILGRNVVHIVDSDPLSNRDTSGHELPSTLKKKWLNECFSLTCVFTFCSSITKHCEILLMSYLFNDLISHMDIDYEGDVWFLVFFPISTTFSMNPVSPCVPFQKGTKKSRFLLLKALSLTTVK